MEEKNKKQDIQTKIRTKTKPHIVEKIAVGIMIVASFLTIAGLAVGFLMTSSFNAGVWTKDGSARPQIPTEAKVCVWLNFVFNECKFSTLQPDGTYLA